MFKWNIDNLMFVIQSNCIIDFHANSCWIVWKLQFNTRNWVFWKNKHLMISVLISFNWISLLKHYKLFRSVNFTTLLQFQFNYFQFIFNAENFPQIKTMKHDLMYFNKACEKLSQFSWKKIWCSWCQKPLMK